MPTSRIYVIDDATLHRKWQQITHEKALLLKSFEHVIQVCSINGKKVVERIDHFAAGFTSTTAHDASLGQHQKTYYTPKPKLATHIKPAGAPATLHSIVIPDMDALNGHDVYLRDGVAHCVSLAQHFGAPFTGKWVPGAEPDKNTPVGTLVATFDPGTGRYTNTSGDSHVGALLSVSDKGIRLLDQYRGRITILPSEYPYGGKLNSKKNKTYESDGHHYRILLVPSSAR